MKTCFCHTLLALGCCCLLAASSHASVKAGGSAEFAAAGTHTGHHEHILKFILKHASALGLSKGQIQSLTNLETKTEPKGGLRADIKAILTSAQLQTLKTLLGQHKKK